MTTQHMDRYFKWLEENAFWNKELLDVKSSKISGIGVFWKHPQQLKSSLIDTILLRVPKNNLLSCKNSLIYNLLVDYNETKGGENDGIDLSQGMHGLIISFIYELYMGLSSPWYDYMVAIDPKVTEIDVPICLWEKEERNLLSNTECAMMGMLNLDELVLLFEECVKFSHTNETYVAIPEIFQVDKDKDLNHYKSQLYHFGACVQSVISRAFQVDDYHGPSLVPGADLFNHLSPVSENGEVKYRENVHFVCDGGMDVCSICGEQQCDHEDEEMEEMEEEEEGEENEESDEKNEESDEENEGNEESEEDEESEGEEQDDDSNSDLDLESEDDNDITEITMDMINELENDQNESESENEDDADETEYPSFMKEVFESDLGTQLSDSAQCVDIVLTRLPQSKYEYEVFNTYGNELADPFLLQRYGFVNQGNLNNNCSLSLQMTKYIKKLTTNSSTGKLDQLQKKLSWLEDNFELLCEVVHEVNLSEHDKEQDEENDEFKLDMEEEDFPESWKVSAKVYRDGKISLHTFAVLELINIPYKMFELKLKHCKLQKKLAQRIYNHLVIQQPSEQHFPLIKTWCQARLLGYPKEAKEAKGTTRSQIINYIINDEKTILNEAIESL